ncbi:MAG: SpoIIE family protein phosphatase [Anaerolineales bacterium]|nr:SpoIIE family protein phosphatase [Anaerolineales bacterium]
MTHSEPGNLEPVYTHILQQAFGNQLDQEALNALRDVAELHHYPAETIVCRQGERGHTFYIIVDGQIATIQQIEGGEKRLLGTLSPGDYFGEMGLIDDTPRMATCQAATAVTLLEITETVFDQMVAENPTIAFMVTRQILQHARNLDHLAIQELQKKNRELRQAYADLQAAQAELVIKERLEHELELAADVQRNLLPGALPQFPDYHFAAYLSPARQVGGDFYDVVPLDDEHVGLLIADVADKGFHAALFMAVTRTLFLQESHHQLSPVAVAQAVHQGMLAVAQSSDVFVTAFYGVLHRPSGVLRYVRAGQERPLLLRPGQPITELPGNGRFLGMIDPLHLKEHTIQLQPGDRLILFSDGVTDAVNPEGKHYNQTRLIASLQNDQHLLAQQLITHILTNLNQWRQDAPTFDDLTLLIVEARDLPSQDQMRTK